MSQFNRTALNILCELAANCCKAEISCIVRCTGKSGGEILGAKGTNAKLLQGRVAIEALHSDYRPIVALNSLVKEQWFKAHALESIAPSTRRLVAVVVPFEGSEMIYLVALCESARREDWNVALLSHLAILVSAVMTGGTEIELSGSNRGGFAETHLQIEKPQGEDAILSFLAKTMPKRPALKARNGVSFAVVRRWKPQLKEAQIAAVQALKLSIHSIAANMAAHDIVETIGNLFQGMRFSTVVPVPGGSSGMERSLSFQIAEKVAAMLDTPFNNCLVGVSEFGSSHPQKSLKLKPYSVQGQVSGTVLLIDDIVTTGTHILKASQALKEAGVASFAIAWIGS